MTRDDATKIARRIMDRIEQERTIHLDSMVDEIVAGMALAAPRHTISEKDVPRSDHGIYGIGLSQQIAQQQAMDQQALNDALSVSGILGISDLMRGAEQKVDLEKQAAIQKEITRQQMRNNYQKAQQDAMLYDTGFYTVHQPAEPDIGTSYTTTLLADSVIASVGIGEDGSLVCYDAFGKKIGD